MIKDIDSSVMGSWSHDLCSEPIKESLERERELFADRTEQERQSSTKHSRTYQTIAAWFFLHLVKPHPLFGKPSAKHHPWLPTLHLWIFRGRGEWRTKLALLLARRGFLPWQASILGVVTHDVIHCKNCMCFVSLNLLFYI